MKKASVSLVHVFVSSTWLDLQPEREAVEAALHRLRETKFVGMEYFGSRDDDTRRASLDEVDGSQVYVGIFAGRYGSGITEAEYRRAREQRLDCLIYFKDEEVIPAEEREADAEKAALLAAIKAELRQHHTVTTFKNPDDLAAKVTADLHHLAPRERGVAIGQFLKHNRWLWALVIVLETPLGILFFRYKDRFLLSWWAYLSLAILLAVVAWSWVKLFRARSSSIPVWRPLLIAGIATVVWSGLLGLQVWAALSPPKFSPNQFGIAVATFGEGPDFRITRRGRQISGLLYSDLSEAIMKTPELSRNVALTRIGVVRDIKQGLVDGERVGAKLVLWGQVLVGDEGVVIHFQVLQTPGMTDNPSFPQTMPVVRRYLESSIDVASTESLVVKEIASQQSLAITAFSLGLFYYLDPDYKTAAEQFKTALDHLQGDQEPAGVTNLGLVYYYLGKSYQMLGRFEQSQAMLDEAARLNPHDPAVVLGQAYNYRVLGQEEQKQQALEKAIALCNQRPSDEIPAIYDRALAYEAMEEHEAALREYRAILDLNPDFFIAYLSAARVLMHLNRPGDIKAALVMYQEAQTLAEGDPVKQVWLNLDVGQLYERIGQTDAAIQAYNHAVDLDPTLVTPYFCLAKLYEDMGIIDAAFLNYNKLIEVSYNPSWAHETFARFLYRIGNHKQAIEHYHEALRYPVYNDALIHTDLGLAYAVADEQDFPDKESRALAEFEAALQNPGSDEHYIRSVYGSVLVQFGYIDEAIAQFERSLELDTGIGVETRLNLGQMYQAIGEPEKARALYEGLVALGDQVPADMVQIAQDRLEGLEEMATPEPLSQEE